MVPKIVSSMMTSTTVWQVICKAALMCGLDGPQPGPNPKFILAWWLGSPVMFCQCLLTMLPPCACPPWYLYCFVQVHYSEFCFRVSTLCSSCVCSVVLYTVFSLFMCACLWAWASALHFLAQHVVQAVRIGGIVGFVSCMSLVLFAYTIDSFLEISRCFTGLWMD